ncbi:hypothetical protein CDAR_222061 [Caerostris darwini]|uniref:Uncharacterized protein n=1 Tax=Caerostris darwini TaxID=1538125 RepID=A0AAV4V171_9ARAC|nr:hypothetical protein CDAR_222061 [Caerostris darwini]
MHAPLQGGWGVENACEKGEDFWSTQNTSSFPPPSSFRGRGRGKFLQSGWQCRTKIALLIWRSLDAWRVGKDSACGTSALRKWQGGKAKKENGRGFLHDKGPYMSLVKLFEGWNLS